MNSVGVPTLLNHMRLTAATGELRRQAEASRIEVTTGRKGDLPLALGGKLFDAQLLRGAIDSVGLHREAISRLAMRAGIAQQALSEANSGASQLNAEMLAALGRGDNLAVTASAVEARARVDTVIARLNVRVEGRSIFAGDAPDQPSLASGDRLISDIAAIYAAAVNPVQLEADLDFYFNDPAGGFATSIYLGGSGGASSIEIDKGEVVNAAAKADEPAVRDLLRGLAMVAVAGSDSQSAYRDAALSNAGSSLLRGADGIVEIRTRIGIDERRAGEAEARLNEEETALSVAYNALTAVDSYDAASRLQALESQIEAAYVLTSRLSRLSLTNFI